MKGSLARGLLQWEASTNHVENKARDGDGKKSPRKKHVHFCETGYVGEPSKHERGIAGLTRVNKGLGRFGYSSTYYRPYFKESNLRLYLP